MLKVAEIACPDKLRAFPNSSLSRMTISRGVEEIARDINNQLECDIGNYVPVSLALDESTDIGSTAQLLIFIRGVNRKLSNFGRTFRFDKNKRSNARL